MISNLIPSLCASGIIVIFAGFAEADNNVDLSTVPERRTVQLTIYNSEDLTLVRETRVVTFKEGSNPLQFSWANTLIDPSSVELEFLTSQDQLDVVDTTFPHDKPQMLYWNVDSKFSGEATIQISYFTSGITWSADYVALATANESTLDIDGYVRVTNNSGEEYEDAQVRLVVGTINLVEKIAQLAQIPMKDVDGLDQNGRSGLRLDAARAFFNRDVKTQGATESAPSNEPADKKIIKEGLSEYFIYTVEGTETVPHGWSKRMRSFEAKQVPVKIVYRYRPNEYGDQLVRMYLLTNNEASKLGTTPLPDGVVRVFRDNGRDGLSYLTQQSIKYIPIGEKIELNLGPDPEVVFELVKERSFRDEIWMQQNGTSIIWKVGADALTTLINATVTGWSDHSVYAQRIRNYTTKPIDVEVRRTFPGDVTFRSQLEPTLTDYQSVEFKTSLAAGARQDLPFEIIQRQGYTAKQNRVVLVGG